GGVVFRGCRPLPAAAGILRAWSGAGPARGHGCRDRPADIPLRFRAKSWEAVGSPSEPLHAVKPRIVQHLPERPLQPVDPFGNAVPRVDQVLPDFEQRMGESAIFGVEGNRIAMTIVAAGIGFVVADDEFRLLPQGGHQRHREPSIAVPQYADMPRTFEALEDRGEAVHGKKTGTH